MKRRRHEPTHLECSLIAPPDANKTSGVPLAGDRKVPIGSRVLPDSNGLSEPARLRSLICRMCWCRRAGSPRLRPPLEAGVDNHRPSSISAKSGAFLMP